MENFMKISICDNNYDYDVHKCLRYAKYVGLCISVVGFNFEIRLNFYYVDKPNDFCEHMGIQNEKNSLDKIFRKGLVVDNWTRGYSIYSVRSINDLNTLSCMDVINLFDTTLNDYYYFDTKLHTLATKMYLAGHRHFRISSNSDLHTYNESTSTYARISIEEIDAILMSNTKTA